MNRILITGTNSGSGKTTITCGILNCLLRRGLKPAAFKCGPDYIDPMFHGRVLGIPVGNLDSYFTKENTLRFLLKKNSKGSDISIIEGVMGYYDGIGFTQKASSEEIALITKNPVILILNCKGMSRSIGALLKGFLDYQSSHSQNIAGVIFNMLPEMLYDEVKKIAIAQGVMPLGFVPKQREEIFKSRHLGLITADEVMDFQNKLDQFSDGLEKTLDLDGIIELSRQAEPLESTAPDFIIKTADTPIKIAVAKDKAFCFLYEDNIELLKEMGCEIEYFSPLADTDFPEGASGLILSGGYPELLAKELSSNKELMEKIRKLIDRGMPCIAECGGFMYLHEELEAEDGKIYKMAGVIPGQCFKTGQLQRFGYIELEAEADNLLCTKGEKIKAHEFHYWDSENPGQGFRAVKPGNGKKWIAGNATKTLYAGFPHFYFYGNPEIAERFIDAARKYNKTEII